MMPRAFGKMTAPLARRTANMIARGVIGIVNAATKMQGVQVKLLSGEIKNDVEHFEPYGLTSNPKTGAEAIHLSLGGDRSHGIVICVADRRFRLTGLEEGEVALYDDLGQHVHLARDGIRIGNDVYEMTLGASGISINAGGGAVMISNASKVRMEGSLEVTGSIKAPVITQGAVP